MPPSPLKRESWAPHASGGVRHLSRRPGGKPVVESPDLPPVLVGQSPAMRQLLSLITRVAPTDSSVLITGATGTGKELVAQAIHFQSNRRGQFIGINCSTLPETLIEAELFGYERGSFTGANESRAGLFEAASGGTLLLDEVDSLSLSAQTKLLRVLQERTVRRIGSHVRIAVDVRVISSSNSDLAKAVAAGTFRADLYYRLRVLPLHLPELCKREGDVELIVDYFLKSYAERSGTPVKRFNSEAIAAMLNYPWPGNVRELENAVEYAVTMGLEEELSLQDLPLEIASQKNYGNSDHFAQVLDEYSSGRVPLAEIERRYILAVLEQFGGNQVRAAAALGIDRSKLYRRMQQYGVKAVRFLQEEQGDGLQLLSGHKSQTARA
jgi:DNA-binding NtrC family response regulator